MAGADFFDAGENGLDGAPVAFKNSLALRSDRIELARPVGRFDANKTLLLEQRQSRIDDARAWRIGAAHAVLNRLDELIAMRRLFADQLQDDQPDVALIK